MASSSTNHQNTAIRVGTGLTKTAANTSDDADSSWLHGTKAGFHDTKSADAPKSGATFNSPTKGSVGDGTATGKAVKEGVKNMLGMGAGSEDK